jgi:prepilin-type N-terminal cleavage/methylation domain-containing protein
VLIARTAKRRLRDDRGFTLIELLIAMVASLAVTGALTAIFIVSLHQSSRLDATVQAAQLGRTAMTKIDGELRTACIAHGFAPIQENSSGSKLIFINSFSPKEEETKSAETEIDAAVKHEIEWTGKSSTEAGSLVETEYQSTAGPTYPSDSEVPEFKSWSSTPAHRTLVTNVKESKNAKEEYEPIFAYKKYASSVAAPTTESGYTTLTSFTEKELPKGGSLSSAQAAETAAVTIKFKAARTDTALKEIESEEDVDLSSEVILAFDAPSSEATISDAPCE